MYHLPRRKCSSGAQTWARFHPNRGACQTTLRWPLSVSRRDFQMLIERLSD
jgi:hypothetical protein